MRLTCVIVLLIIEFLRPVRWTEDLFKNLVLPAEEKDLLLELARSHSRATATFDDFVIGKGKPPSPTSTLNNLKHVNSSTGKGMIVLLDGPPGVGKTLTAESVAEDMKAPLYTMSAGELGTDANTVETRLSDILELATMWNAILLIDEADVFMEKRSPHDLERNELVSSKFYLLAVLFLSI
jgi:ATP-dependent protease Clp ATPase subunit